MCGAERRSSAARAVHTHKSVMRLTLMCQWLQARFLQLGVDVQTALRAALWNTPLRDGAEAGSSSALGAISALEGSLRMAAETVSGCTDDWDLPDTASARVSAQHLTQVCHATRHAHRRGCLGPHEILCIICITNELQRLLPDLSCTNGTRGTYFATKLKQAGLLLIGPCLC